MPAAIPRSLKRITAAMFRGCKTFNAPQPHALLIWYRSLHVELARFDTFDESDPFASGELQWRL